LYHDRTRNSSSEKKRLAGRKTVSVLDVLKGEKGGLLSFDAKLPPTKIFSGALIFNSVRGERPPLEDGEKKETEHAE